MALTAVELAQALVDELCSGERQAQEGDNQNVLPCFSKGARLEAFRERLSDIGVEDFEEELSDWEDRPARWTDELIASFAQGLEAPTEDELASWSEQLGLEPDFYAVASLNDEEGPRGFALIYDGTDNCDVFYDLVGVFETKAELDAYILEHFEN